MTPRQRKCFDILMYHFDKALDDLMTFQGDLNEWLEELDRKLDQTATIVDTMAAGAALGVVLVPITGGTSLVVAGVCEVIAAGITVGKALNGCIRALWDRNNSPAISPECESAWAAFKTSTRAGLTMVAHAMVVYYAHIINEVMEECSLPTFASYGASRILKKLKIELKQQLQIYSDSTIHIKVILVPEVFIDYLLQSVTLSQRSEKITLNPRYCPANWMGSREMPVKWAFSRSRLVLPIKSRSLLDLAFYASVNEGHFLSDGTLACYGYVMLQLFCDRTALLQVNHRRYQEIRVGEEDESEARKHLTLYFSVSREEIEDYVNDNRRAPRSLNVFLSERYGLNIVAVIRRDVLSFCDLSDTDFSGVVGHEVFIEKSNLKGSKWDGAFLPHAIIQDIETDQHTSFRGAFLEFSDFSRVVFIGDWSGTRLNFSTLTDCKISTLMFNEMTNWSWVTTSNVIIDDQREDIVALSTAAAAGVIESKIEESEEKLGRQWLQKLREREQAARDIEQIKEDELLKWRDEQKRLEIKHAEITQAIFNELYALRNQPEIDLMHKVNEHFKALYKMVIAQPHVDLFIRIGNLQKTNMLTFVSCLRESKAQFTAAIIEGTLGSGKTTDVASALVSLRTDTDIDSIDSLSGETLTIQKQDDWVLELFPLWKVRDFTESDLLTACLNKNGYVTSQELAILKTKPCLFVLDGLEDCRVDINQHAILDEIYRCHQDWEKLVIIITVTTEYRMKNPFFYERMGYGGFSALPEDNRARVLPFTKEQIDTYFRLYFPKQLSLEAPEFSDSFPVEEIYRMARSPIMAHIICEVFSGKGMGNVPRTPVEFCKAFIELWYESILEKAKNNKLSLVFIDIQDFIKTIAFEMFKQKQSFIDRPFESERGFFQERLELQHAATMLAMLFTDPECKKAGTLMPLSVEVIDGKNRYKFLHKLIHFFALGMKLIDILEHESLEMCIDAWNCNFVTEHDIYMFMEGVFKERCVVHGNEAKMLDKLRNMVTRSASDHTKSVAASNAITLLNRLGYDFSRRIETDEWRGIHVPYANLRRARLARLNFSDSANFQYVQFQHAEIAGANFQGCDTRGARFLSDAERHHYVTKRPRAVTRYKNDTIDVITYAIPVASEKAEHQIVSIGLDGKKYPTMKGHKSKILCMAWGINGLISASKNGTIRYWSERGEEKQKFKYEQKIPIYSLSWHHAGHIFASAGADGWLYVWDKRRSEALIEKVPIGGVLRRVLFGRSVLVVGGDLAKLHIWHYSGELQFSFSLHYEVEFSDPIQSLAWSPTETSVAVGLKNGKIYLQKIRASYASREILEGPRCGVLSIAWHIDGDRLVAGGEDGAVYIWSVARKELLSVQYGDGTPIEEICILADGRRVLAAQDRMLSVWEADATSTRSSIYSNEITHRIKCLQAYENKLITGHLDGSVRLWQINLDGEKSAVELYRHELPVEQILLSPDRNYIAISDAFDAVFVFEFHTNTVEWVRFHRPVTRILEICWIKDDVGCTQPDLAALTDQGIFIWRRNQAQREWLPRDSFLLQDGRCLVSQKLGSLCAVSDGVNINLLQYQNRIFQRWLLCQLASPVTQLAWSPDDEWLAMIDRSSNVYLFNMRTHVLQCVDQDQLQEKKIFWILTESKMRLVVSSLEAIKSMDVNSMGLGQLKKISSGAEQLAIGENLYYLASKMSIDIMQYVSERLTYCSRIGSGLCARDANFTAVKVSREDEIKALEMHGAILSKPWFRFSFFNSEQVHPLPPRVQHEPLEKQDPRWKLLKKQARRQVALEEYGEGSSPSESVQSLDITTGQLSRKPSSPVF